MASPAVSQPTHAHRWAFRGTVIHCLCNPFLNDPKPEEWLQILENHVMLVGYNGRIHSIVPDSALFDAEEEVILQKHEFLVPGFIDTHIHAAQYRYAGTGTDRPLTGADGWLETYAFAAERDVHASKLYPHLVSSTLYSGTTTAVYFGTLYVEPCKVLVDTCMKLGQRALIGKVSMDRNAPDDYVQSCTENVNETVALIEYIHQVAGQATPEHLPLILPVVTPRFIPTCTPQLLEDLGKVAQRYDCHVQSHISESLDEVAWSKALDEQDHGTSRTDAEIFDAHGLLRKSIMAHGVWLNDDDCELMKERHSSIACCPLSNFFFAHGSLACKCRLQQGMLVGLGTDVAGGYHPQMFHSQRMAVVASKSLDHQTMTGDHSIDYRLTFYLATLGGAKAIHLEDQLGNFGIGKLLDALVLSSNNIYVAEEDTVLDVWQKIMNLGDDRNVRQVYVAGRRVKDA